MKRLIIIILLVILFPSKVVSMETFFNCIELELNSTCRNIQLAKLCKTTPYCIHCTWNTAFLPTDAKEKKCMACKATIEHANKISSMEREHLSFMTTLCKTHEAKEDTSTCLAVVLANANLNFEAVNEIGISSEEICALLGFCYLEFEVQFQKVDIDSNDPKNYQFGVISAQNAATSHAKVYNNKGKNYSPVFTTDTGKIFNKYFCEFREEKERSHTSMIIIVTFVIINWITLIILLACSKPRMPVVQSNLYEMNEMV